MSMQCHHFTPNSRTQQGVVLFVALIALVVMSLAAVALIRSVDTNTIIAGNLAFKQSATNSADSGIETAIAWLESTAVNNANVLKNDSAEDDYFATSTGDAKALADASTTIATGSNITDGTDSSGNTIHYVIQRMCTAPGEPTESSCLFGAPVAGTSSQGVKSAPEAGAILNNSQSPMYRITAKVAGPKNTVSYIQAFVY